MTLIRWVDGELVAMTEEERAAFESEREGAPVLALPKVYSKRKLFGAMSDEQFAVFKQYHAQQPPRMQAVFDEAQQLSDADLDWPQFIALMNTAYGETEAARLLNEARI